MTAPKNPLVKDETPSGGVADLEAARRVFRLESDGISARGRAGRHFPAVGMLSRLPAG